MSSVIKESMKMQREDKDEYQGFKTYREGKYIDYEQQLLIIPLCSSVIPGVCRKTLYILSQPLG
jgi:hypothetical protein